MHAATANPMRRRRATIPAQCEMYAKVSFLAKKIERVHIPGMGHHIRYAAPEAYAQAFEAFLSKV